MFFTHSFEYDRIVGMLSPGKERSFCECKARIDDDFFGKRVYHTKSVTLFTGTVVRIERKMGDIFIL